LSDARVLIDRAQLKAQQHKVTYDSDIDTLSIVKDICDLKQICTQSGGLRPFGVSVLIAGIDDHTPKVFETDPIGIYFQYKATAIGEGEVEVDEILHNEWKPEITIEDALKLSLKALRKVLGENYNVERIESAYIKIDEKKCNGCGNCVTGCHEGALQIIDGKARLISDLLCDGLGACIGECPQDAIKIETRAAEPYDEVKVMDGMVKHGPNTIKAHLKHLKDHAQKAFLKQAFELGKSAVAKGPSSGIL